MTMSQRPTGAEAEARRQQSRAEHAAVTQVLNDNEVRAGHEPQLFFVELHANYAKKPHPVLGEVWPEEALGLRADNLTVARQWAQHWLGMRGFVDVLTREQFEGSTSFPGGCPRIWDVPPARYYVHPQGARIIVWAVPNGHDVTPVITYELDAYGVDGKRKQTSATPEALEEGHGAWRETFFSFDGEELTRNQIVEILIQAGVY